MRYVGQILFVVWIDLTFDVPPHHEGRMVGDYGMPDLDSDAKCSPIVGEPPREKRIL